MPAKLDQYRIIKKLSEGGFGETFLAEDTHIPTSRPCVVKKLKLDDDPTRYAIMLKRFSQEARALESLSESSRQIPRLYAYFADGGYYYLVQEWIDGDTIHDLVKHGGAQSNHYTRHFLEKILPVLEYIHSEKCIHRDIKPDNIIVRRKDDLPVLIDFGAVKEIASGSDWTLEIGTPGYMPREQRDGRPLQSSDLYSLGLTAIFLLTGKAPRELERDAATGSFKWTMHCPGIDKQLAEVISRAIELQPADRYIAAREMLDALSSATPAERTAVTVQNDPLGSPQSDKIGPASDLPDFAWIRDLLEQVRSGNWVRVQVLPGDGGDEVSSILERNLADAKVVYLDLASIVDPGECLVTLSGGTDPPGNHHRVAQAVAGERERLVVVVGGWGAHAQLHGPDSLRQITLNLLKFRNVQRPKVVLVLVSLSPTTHMFSGTPEGSLMNAAPVVPSSGDASVLIDWAQTRLSDLPAGEVQKLLDEAQGHLGAVRAAVRAARRSLTDRLSAVHREHEREGDGIVGALGPCCVAVLRGTSQRRECVDVLLRTGILESNNGVLSARVEAWVRAWTAMGFTS